MLIKNLMECFCSDSCGSLESVVPADDKGSPTTVAPRCSSVDDEVSALARFVGGIQSGQQLRMTLAELLSAIPKQRRRSDAYVPLIKKLKTDYDVNLEIIKNQKSYD